MSLLENKKVPEAREQVSFLQDFSVPMIDMQMCTTAFTRGKQRMADVCV